MNIQLDPIPVLCLFCDATLVADSEIDYLEHDMLKCPNCGENNLYGEVMDIAKEKAKKAAAEYAIKEISKSLKFKL
ncbi:hypothetical protein [Vibrio metoecus]|uniref:hypothetical protein n=1 Tax=Vibrio metoecus TaxID=1481663 RepID=UPI00215D543B|nr:hypothetical protein [Vibrio metoecus]MCR9387607.1 hypothetical protein [Vibrio metoecus]